MLRCEELPCCYRKERQQMKEISDGEQHIIGYINYAHMKQCACGICLLTSRQFNIYISMDQGINKDFKVMRRKQIISD